MDWWAISGWGVAIILGIVLWVQLRGKVGVLNDLRDAKDEIAKLRNKVK